MNKRSKKFVLVLPFLLVIAITFNFFQKSMMDKEHSHSHHDSLVHIHEHFHQQNSHTHQHSSQSITILDYYYSSYENDQFSIEEKDKNQFEITNMNSFDYIVKLLKPPRFS